MDTLVFRILMARDPLVPEEVVVLRKALPAGLKVELRPALWSNPEELAEEFRTGRPDLVLPSDQYARSRLILTNRASFRGCLLSLKRGCPVALFVRERAGRQRMSSKLMLVNLSGAGRDLSVGLEEVLFSRFLMGP